MELKDDFILITLLDDDYKYNPIKTQVRNGIEVIPEVLDDITRCVKNKVIQIGNKIAPQTDVCIDIFVRSKDEIIDKIKVVDEYVGFEKAKEIIYISKSTRSDKPFIEKMYSLENIGVIKSFKAFGDATLPVELELVGVRRIAEAATTIDLIKKLAEIRSRTDLKFVIG